MVIAPSGVQFTEKSGNVDFKLRARSFPELCDTSSNYELFIRITISSNVIIT